MHLFLVYTPEQLIGNLFTMEQKTMATYEFTEIAQCNLVVLSYAQESESRAQRCSANSLMAVLSFCCRSSRATSRRTSTTLGMRVLDCIAPLRILLQFYDVAIIFPPWKPIARLRRRICSQLRRLKTHDTVHLHSINSRYSRVESRESWVVSFAVLQQDIILMRDTRVASPPPGRP